MFVLSSLLFSSAQFFVASTVDCDICGAPLNVTTSKKSKDTCSAVILVIYHSDVPVLHVLLFQCFYWSRIGLIDRRLSN